MFTDPERAPNINTLWASVFVDELIRCGLRQAVIAPGARSAPLVFQLAERPEVEDVSIIDERSAAFFALGLARASGRPVALLCTSGTAAANFHPAVCEAAQDDVPLLVLTGNRPDDVQDCGSQQVMDQYELYGGQVRWFHRMAQPELRAEKLRYLRATVCRAWALTRSARPGPVHLDVPVRKPLEPIPDPSDPMPERLPDALRLAVRGREDGRCWLDVRHATPQIDAGTLDDLVERLHSARRPLILAGTDRRGLDCREALTDFAERASIPILAEAGSNLRHWQERGRSVIGTGELIAASGVYDRIGPPDLILRLGHHPLTWAMQGLVDATIEQIQLAAADHLIDPDHRLSGQIIADPADLFRRLAERIEPDRSSDWLDAHRQAESMIESVLDSAIAAESRLNAPRFWRELGALLPDGCRLCYSSSMQVRHLETFLHAPGRSLELHFNRGLNGIDGVVSTAAGLAASPSRRKTVLVIGDVALRHDAQALMLAVELGLDLTVFVVDNDGGEIFEYLPGARFEHVHEKHFATVGHTPLVDVLPRAIEIDQPQDWQDFRRSARAALADDQPRLVRVSTQRREDKAFRDRLIVRVRDELVAERS
jgi:2-succinyl-5-enolpyruvyl-6-hydroxy-3-cyclohexene-1-carboxylate synthase